MHMNAGRSNMTKESKTKMSRWTLALRWAQCWWHAYPQLNVIPSKKFHETYHIYIQVATILLLVIKKKKFNQDNPVQTYVALGNNVQVTVLEKGTVGIVTKQGSKSLCLMFIMSKV